MQLIEDSEDEVLIVNAYLVPSRELIDAIKAATRTCVRVIVVTNGPNTNDLPELAGNWLIDLVLGPAVAELGTSPQSFPNQLPSCRLLRGQRPARAGCRSAILQLLRVRRANERVARAKARRGRRRTQGGVGCCGAQRRRIRRLCHRLLPHARWACAAIRFAGWRFLELMRKAAGDNGVPISSGGGDE